MFWFAAEKSVDCVTAQCKLCSREDFLYDVHTKGQCHGFSVLPAQVAGQLPRDLHSLGSGWTQQCQWGGTVRSDEQTSRYWNSTHRSHIDLFTHCAPNGFTGGYIDDELRLVKVDGMMPTVVGLEQVTSVRSTPEISTPLLHPHSPGRGTALQVARTF